MPTKFAFNPGPGVLTRARAFFLFCDLIPEGKKIIRTICDNSSSSLLR